MFGVNFNYAPNVCFFVSYVPNVKRWGQLYPKFNFFGAKVLFWSLKFAQSFILDSQISGELSGEIHGGPDNHKNF